MTTTRNIYFKNVMKFIHTLSDNHNSRLTDALVMCRLAGQANFRLVNVDRRQQHRPTVLLVLLVLLVIHILIFILVSFLVFVLVMFVVRVLRSFALRTFDSCCSVPAAR